MKYAVVEIKGKQYKVEEGGEYLVDLHSEKEEINSRVLLYKDGKLVSIGKPYLGKINIKVKKLENVKGNKIHIMKYKAKSRFRRKTGFRPKYTRILVEKIA